MKFTDMLKPDTVMVTNKPKSDEDLLHCIAEIASNAGAGASQDTIFNALSEREKLSSTACGHGIAIPHCRIPDMSEFTIGMIVCPEGLDFNSATGNNVSLFPFVIGPLSEPRVHLKLLSSIAQAFRDRELRDSLRKASSSKSAFEILLNSLTPEEIAETGSGRKMMQVFIQDESIFDELLQVFAALGNSSSIIMDADDSTRFLMNIPFYAGFWNTDIQHFSRVIISVVRNELVNAIVRNIEFICGPLSARSDIMVTISDLHSVFGSLEG